MKQLWMDWQTFAEAAEAGQETGGETGGQAAPDAGEQEAFSALIRGQYKAVSYTHLTLPTTGLV